MPELNLDLSGYEPSNGYEFELLPAGFYQGRAATVTEGPNKSGDSMITVVWVIENDTFEGKYADRMLWDWFTIAGPNANKNIPRLKACLLACEFENPNCLERTEDLEGRSCIFRVYVKDDKRRGQQGIEYRGGRQQNRIAEYLTQDAYAALVAKANEAQEKKPPEGEPKPMKPAPKKSTPFASAPGTDPPAAPAKPAASAAANGTMPPF
jgi:hypothetical protein